jgi:hypothetical protein
VVNADIEYVSPGAQEGRHIVAVKFIVTWITAHRTVPHQVPIQMQTIAGVGGNQNTRFRAGLAELKYPLEVNEGVNGRLLPRNPNPMGGLG